jgi:hypothetical protein
MNDASLPVLRLPENLLHHGSLLGLFVWLRFSWRKQTMTDLKLFPRFGEEFIAYEFFGLYT